jgi:hypothetical protein
VFIRIAIVSRDDILVQEGLDDEVEALTSPSQPEPVVWVIRRLLFLLGVFEHPIESLDEQLCGQIEKAARALGGGIEDCGMRVWLLLSHIFGGGLVLKSNRNGKIRGCFDAVPGALGAPLTLLLWKRAGNQDGKERIWQCHFLSERIYQYL